MYRRKWPWAREGGRLGIELPVGGATWLLWILQEVLQQSRKGKGEVRELKREKGGERL
jgi:hypothetical protein